MGSTSTQMLGKGAHGNVKGTQRDLSRGPAPSATTGLGDLGEDGKGGFVISISSCIISFCLPEMDPRIPIYTEKTHAWNN